MITAAIINDNCKVVWVRKDEHARKRIARIYALTGVVPESVAEETKVPGVFRDRINKIMLVLKGETIKQHVIA